ncbi:alpha/beta hydrolase [Brevibacterium sp.]|uniref:RBBP9/YdeN family alpha/beta hydrolase n=1 Tax=Brevibacterium sp. TaxID=1701 RepID=UPI0025BB36F9|nr:alpha/beta hydrolase [Brevibacterium sp.]
MTPETPQTPHPTQTRASIFHGYGASPEDHWFGWLAQRLSADGVRTTIPALPDPLAPLPTPWTDAVLAALGTPERSSIAVAHSLGCLAVLRCLRTLRGNWRLGTLVLVSGFVDTLPALPELDAFIGDGCDVTGLREHVDRIRIIRSDDDPLVPPSHTDRLADLLGASVEVVPGAGHFLASDGVTALPKAYAAVMG